MFWTAFVWGLGATCGGGVGVILTASAWAWLDYVAGPRSKVGKTVQEMNELSFKALVERNELTEETNRILSQIVTAMAKDE